jgi:hypothetical protein
MVGNCGIEAALRHWAEKEPSVQALVQIGSRVRANAAAECAADAFSDWDYQIVSSDPEMFAGRAWFGSLGLGEPLAYVARLGRLGSATKISIAARDGEIDLVVLPAVRLRQAKWLLKLGLAGCLPGMRGPLGGLALVLRDGHRIVKGEEAWGDFFRRVAGEFPVPRLGDCDVTTIAEGFVCDFISTRKKIERGEFLAAQRWLHHQLAEVNFQLLHELRLRRGETTFPDARRVERLVADWRTVEVSALPTAENLRAATEKSAATLRELMAALVPEWRWPAV